MSEQTRQRAVRGYIYALTAASALCLAGWLYLFGLPSGRVVFGTAAVLALVCAVSRRFPVSFGRATVELVDVAVLTALVLLGPVWALVVAAPSVFYRNRLRTAFVGAYYVLALLTAGYVLQLLSGPLLSASGFTPESTLGASAGFGASFVYGAVAACAAFYALEALANGVLMLLKYEEPLLLTFRESYLPLVPADVAVVSATLGASYALSVFGPAAPPILFSGAAAASVLLHFARKRLDRLGELESDNARLQERTVALEEGLLSSHLEFAARLVGKLGRRDGRLAELAAATAVYAADAANEFGLEPARTDKLRLAALLQDVGLVSAPDEVLLTPPEKLNSVGQMHLREHTVDGEHLLSAAPGFEEAARWVRWHHEREDGTGYPDKLRGEWIPLEAKVLAVCGEYAALVLDGPASPGLSPQEARRELVSLSGKSLDETAVRTLLRLLDAEGENYAAAADERFALPAYLAPGGRATGAAGAPGAPSDLRPTGTVEND